MSSTGVQRKFRDRATRLKRALVAEKRRYGGIDDGYGKRYLIGPFYALAGDFKQALAHYDWYEKECANDVGEPVHYLWWALSLYRTGDLEKASSRLLETMVRNVYLLPALIGFPAAPHDIWHSSNREQPGYISEVSPELLPDLSERERQWIEERLDTALFPEAAGVNGNALASLIPGTHAGTQPLSRNRDLHVLPGSCARAFPQGN